MCDKKAENKSAKNTKDLLYTKELFRIASKKRLKRWIKYTYRHFYYRAFSLIITGLRARFFRSIFAFRFALHSWNDFSDFIFTVCWHF